VLRSVWSPLPAVFHGVHKDNCIHFVLPRTEWGIAAGRVQLLPEVVWVLSVNHFYRRMTTHHSLPSTCRLTFKNRQRQYLWIMWKYLAAVQILEWWLQFICYYPATIPCYATGSLCKLHCNLSFVEFAPISSVLKCERSIENSYFSIWNQRRIRGSERQQMSLAFSMLSC
jgi:hypothetical protein